MTGQCCGNGTVTDGSGRCCDGVVDACGVCGGGGIVVDVRGVCCGKPLSAAGLCCDTTDSCGVCGGANLCPAVVTLQVADAAVAGSSRVLSDAGVSPLQLHDAIVAAMIVPSSAVVLTSQQVSQTTALRVA